MASGVTTMNFVYLFFLVNLLISVNFNTFFLFPSLVILSLRWLIRIINPVDKIKLS